MVPTIADQVCGGAVTGHASKASTHFCVLPASGNWRRGGFAPKLVGGIKGDREIARSVDLLVPFLVSLWAGLAGAMRRALDSGLYDRTGLLKDGGWTETAWLDTRISQVLSRSRPPSSLFLGETHTEMRQHRGHDVCT